MAKFDGSKVLQYLEEKWKGRSCPMCGAASWAIQDSSFQLSEFNDGATVIGGPVIPVIPVTCSNCGNTVLVNAIVAGTTKRAAGAKE